MDKNLLHTKAEVTKTEDDGIVEAIVASTSVLDRMGDVIEQDGWELKNFKKNPVILWGHNVREEKPPIAKALKVWIEGAGKKAKLMFKAQFDMADDFAAEIFRKVKDGFLNTVSVGFIPTEWEELKEGGHDRFETYRYTKAELLEISFVPVPANPEAAVILRSMGIEPVEEKNLYIEVPKIAEISKEETEKIDGAEDVTEVKETKGVIPYKATGKAPEAEGWDGPGETAKAEVSDLKIICTWFDSEKPDVKSSYKLPHHKAQDHSVVWRGVAAAMAALLGARGGTKVPDGDRRGIYNHLAKHYKDFDKETPDFRFVEEQVLKTFDEEITALMLDREDRYTIRLLKKLIEMVKVQKQPQKTNEPIVDALKVIDEAITIAKTKMKGGEK